MITDTPDDESPFASITSLPAIENTRLSAISEESTESEVPVEPVVVPGIFDDIDDTLDGSESGVEENTNGRHVPPLSYEHSLIELDDTIRKIVDPTIRQKTIAVKDRLVAIYPQSENKEELVRYLDLTNQLLKAKPGEERGRIADQYLRLATTAKYSHSPVLQALGIAMIILGITIAALSTALCITQGLAPIGAAGLLGGLGMFAAGVYLVDYGRPHRETTELMNALHADVIDADSNAPLIENRPTL